MFESPILTPLTDLEPAAYNPREADQHRLHLLGVSLRKFGFILPLYATRDGHLLSGHQRLLTATNMGCTHVPVIRVDVNPSLARNINLVFNRATNDMRQSDTSANLFERISMERVAGLFQSLPDRQPTDHGFYRVMQVEEVPLEELLEHVSGYDAAAVAMACKLLNLGVVMPVVRAASGRIVNGRFRLMAAAEQRGKGQYKSQTYPVVTISDEEAELSDALLNMISMRFTVEKQYADQLRYGSFRRMNNVVEDLTATLRFYASGDRNVAAHQSLRKPEKFWHIFRRELGESICDLGAGQRRQRALLEAKGIRCIDWEPYPLDWRNEIPGTVDRSRPSLDLARKVSDEFLTDVATGCKYSTVALPAVLNSVPFHFDRMCVLAMAHALCGFDSQLIGSVRNARLREKITERPTMRAGEDGSYKMAISIFSLDYEPNVQIADVSAAPKVQKFHSVEEITAMLRVFFERVEVKDGGGYIFYRARQPRRIQPTVLKRALMQQFNLPWPDDQRLDRVAPALAAFGARLGIDFGAVQEAPLP